MKLTDAQKRILNAVLLRANAPIAEISRIVGLKDHIVRRGVTFLQDHGIFLRRSIWIDPHALGFTLFIVHLELPLAASRYRAQFIKSLVALDESCSVAELGGEGLIEVRILARGREQLWTIFERLATQLNFSFQLCCCLTLVDSEYSGTFEGSPLRSLTAGLSFGLLLPDAQLYQADERDHAILSVLANQTYMNLQEAARLLSMPAATLSYRIEKLENAGIIKGHYYIMDPKVFGETPVCLQMRTRVLTGKQASAIKTFGRLHPQISAVSLLLGEISVEMYALVREQRQIQEILHQVSEQFGDCIYSVKTVPQIGFAKYTLYPFQKNPYSSERSKHSQK